MIPVDLLDQLAVVVDVQVVGLAHEEDRWLVDALPDSQGRFPVHLSVLQGSHDEDGLSGLRLSGLDSLSALPRLQAEHHPPVPHHGFEVALEGLVASVMATGHVLAVVLQVAEDGRFGEALVSPDEVQLGVDIVSHVSGDLGAGFEQN